MSSSSSGALKLKAGDVVATQTVSKWSWLIRLATGGAWSHVGIAIDENTILEAVKGSKSRSDKLPQVREISVEEFVGGSSKYLHCRRPKCLTAQETIKLNSFSSAISEKTYTSINAAATVAISWLRVALMVFVAGWFVVIKDKLISPQFACGYAIVTLILFFYLYVLYQIQIWAFQCPWGVKTTERLFKMVRLGAWLVKEKYNVFCSKLVLLADKEVGGEIHRYTPDANNVQPNHIVKACKRLGWEVCVKKNGRERALRS